MNDRNWRLAAILALLIAGAGAWDVRDDYRLAVATEQQRLSDLARIGEAQISGSLRGISLLLQDIGEEIYADAPPPEETIVAHVRARLKTLPEVRHVFATDAKGITIFHTLPGWKGLDASQRPYFLGPKGMEDKNALHVSDPTKAGSGNVVIFVAKAVLNSKGEFIGAISASVAPAYFGEVLYSLVPPGDSSAILINGGGIVLAREPEMQKYQGTDVSKGIGYSAHRASGQRETTARIPVVTDGRERLVVYRGLSNSPLVVAVTRAADDIVRAWFPRAAVKIAVLGFLVAAAATLAWASRP